MFADLNPGRAGGNGIEFAPKFQGRLRFEVKTFLLGQAAGEENVNHRARARPRRLAWSSQRLQGGQLIHAQPQQSDGARLEGSPARNAPTWMEEGGRRSHVLKTGQRCSPFAPRSAPGNGAVADAPHTALATRPPGCIGRAAAPVMTTVGTLAVAKSE